MDSEPIGASFLWASPRPRSRPSAALLSSPAPRLRILIVRTAALRRAPRREDATKKLALFCDGTWNRLHDAERPQTNVAILARHVAREGPGPGGRPVAQVVFYDDGVGAAGTAVDGWAERLAGGAFGAGLMRNIEDAYRFLIFNYDPGDEIYLFGFSRGAFTARSLVGLLNTAGMLRQAEANRVGDALALYKDPAIGPHARESVRFRRAFGRPGLWLAADDPGARRGVRFQVRFLGVWDTVGRLGLPELTPLAAHLNRAHAFHDTRLSRTVAIARHAVALDEDREAFAPATWESGEPLARLTAREAEGLGGEADYREVWFPGDHGSVGGGGDVLALSNDALRWIARDAVAAGLALTTGFAQLVGRRRACDHLAPLCNITPGLRRRMRSSALERAFGALMDALPRAPRLGPRRIADLSDTALLRCRDDRRYRARAPLTRARLTEQSLARELVLRGLERARTCDHASQPCALTPQRARPT